jgi:hypothetical protein
MPFNILIAFQWPDFTTGILMVVVLMGLLLVPFLIKANRDGKRQLGRGWLRRGTTVKLGPLPPIGMGDNTPGRVGDPAPGMPDGQPNPWGSDAQREAPPIQS